MKNRNCPNKDACWDYDASNCKGCAVGQKFEEYILKIKRLQAEVAELHARLENGYVPVRKKKRATEKQISIDEYMEGLK